MVNPSQLALEVGLTRILDGCTHMTHGQMGGALVGNSGACGTIRLNAFENYPPLLVIQAAHHDSASTFLDSETAR
jgi:hypothetical protein